MKLPKKPPDVADLLQKYSKDDPNLLAKLLGPGMVDEKGRYLHWDEIRFKKHPDGLAAEQVWLGVRLARMFSQQRLPLLDGAGNTLTYCEPHSVKAALRNLDMNAGGSLASDVTAISSDDGRLYLARSLAEEPFASSLIEGAATTRQIAKKLIFEGREPLTKDERMVLNNYRALEFVKSHRGDPLSLDMILEAHRIITEGTLENPSDAGRIRTSNDVQVVDNVTAEILYNPPSHDQLPERLGRLIEFANSVPSKDEWVHPLLKAVLLHFALAYEHPFVDGNGRLARALFYWSALRDGYWLVEYVSISSVIAEAPIQYGNAYLHTEHDDGDATYFLIYNLQVLEKAIKRLGEYVGRRRTELITFEKRISDSHLFNHRQTWLLNELARNRATSVTIAEHRARSGVSYLTARSDLETLTTLGFLRKDRQKRASVYLPARDLVSRLTAASLAGAAS